jgi:hypothetical protein
MKASAKLKASFVDNLARGAPPALAAQAIGVDRATAYRWKAADPAFAEQWDDARDRKTELVEAVLFREAMKGQPWAVCFYLKTNKPAVYNRRQHDPDDAPPVRPDDDYERVVFVLPDNSRHLPEPDPPLIEGEAA